MQPDPWAIDAGGGATREDAGAETADAAVAMDDAGAPARDAGEPETPDTGTEVPALLVKSEVVGGTGGTAFDDATAFQPPVTVASLLLSGEARLDRVGILHDDGTTLNHGGVGGTQQVLQLESGEVLTAARLCTGDRNGSVRVFYARFETSHARTLAAGTETSDCVQLTAPADQQIVGFFGRADLEIDALGLLYAPR